MLLPLFGLLAVELTDYGQSVGRLIGGCLIGGLALTFLRHWWAQVLALLAALIAAATIAFIFATESVSSVSWPTSFRLTFGVVLALWLLTATRAIRSLRKIPIKSSR